MSRRSRLGVCPAGLFIAARRHVGATVKRVSISLKARIGFLQRVNGPCRTGHLCRHIAFSLRVVHRLKRYSNVRGCSHCFSNHRTNRQPFYLLSCFPGSFLLIISRDRIAVPRVQTVCKNSCSHGGGLISCNFHLPTTVSGHPLAFSRFRSLAPLTVCIDTAPTSCRLRGDRKVIISRIVHPANLLSPIVRIHPALGRVSSLVRRVARHTTISRHILIAALAGHVTRRLATCLAHVKVHYGCVRDSISALRHVRVVSSLQGKLFSILVNIGLLHRKLSLPRISLITVLSTSGRNFLHSRHSLARATKHTTQGIGKGIVFCTSGVASDVHLAVSRATHEHRGRLTCGRGRNVAPGRIVGGDISLITRGRRPIANRPCTCIRPRPDLITSPMIRCVGHGRLRGTVRQAGGRVVRTTGGLSFVRTTRFHSRLIGLRSLLIAGGS